MGFPHLEKHGIPAACSKLHHVAPRVLKLGLEIHAARVRAVIQGIDVDLDPHERAASNSTTTHRAHWEPTEPVCMDNRT